MKKLLFVIESLVCGGAEKSLVTLLRLLDYSKYEVDLQLLSYGGEFEALLPKEVRLLPELPYFVKTRKTLYQALFALKSAGDVRVLTSRIQYSFFLRTGKHSNPDRAVMFWQFAGSCFERKEKKYDVAIAYSQGVPTFYVADCIDAAKKYAWVNGIYSLNLKYRNYVYSKYKKIDTIVGVSDAVIQRILDLFPQVKEKTAVIYDINDGRLVEELAKFNLVQAQREMKRGKMKILTVGRLVTQKGYDIALDACAILKEKNIDFCWYVIGGGALEGEIKELIEEKHLEDCFIMLGVKSNPYPYFVQSQLYVQTSRYEGFGIAIAEARILNIPVVTTRFSAVYAQMIEGENGIVVDINAEAVAEGIQRLIKDKELYEHIKSYQMTEKKTNYEELEKIYKMIDGDILTG